MFATSPDEGVDVVDCPKCDQKMIWDSDCTADEAGYSEDGLVSFFHCADCGSSAVFHQPLKDTSE